jgi:hypothetical protein
MTTKDYIYCEDCETYVDRWKFDNIEDTGHADCRWRYVTEDELKDCVAECEIYYPYCPNCGAIVDFDVQTGNCSHCGKEIDKHNVILENCFGEVAMHFCSVDDLFVGVE